MPVRRPFSVLLLLLAVLAAAACGDVSLLGGGGDDGDDDPSRAVLLTMQAPASPEPGDYVDVFVRIFNARDVVSTPFKLRFDQGTLRFESSGSRAGPFLEQDDGNVVFIASPDSQDPGVVAVGLSLLGAETGVSGEGDLCILRFEILPQASSGDTTIEPFDAFVFSPGLVEQTVLFTELVLTVN